MLTYSLAEDHENQYHMAETQEAYKQREENRKDYLTFSPLPYDTLLIVVQSERPLYFTRWSRVVRVVLLSHISFHFFLKYFVSFYTPASTSRETTHLTSYYPFLFLHTKERINLPTLSSFTLPSVSPATTLPKLMAPRYYT